ncbi:gamma-glutamylcyclotransferase ChaC [Francisella hispaniensis]|uniref:gamma-glutamylcyclotransferase ChaC n=1 Tax=Francisella hispaniensis TaxID=622488 RepID=UPI001908EC6E|nr:gamma-glutamylcyclotransferase [Francisella hispaniensis]MBK2357760.1 gamma-glutamylcyclotransferase [Francisella hispaniensis]
MKKKNILILILIVVVIAASFLLGKKSGFNKAESIHESELKILEQSKLSQTPEDSLNCRPEVNPNKDNYVIGYGSLMNKDSRQITVPNATYAAPILVSGFERLWASRGEKSRATFLLAVPNKGYAMNAIYYKADAKDISATDLREASYCRVKIPRKDIVPLGIKSLPKGDFWMYVKDFKDAEFPNKNYPILQTYADVFMTGCLQTQAEFNLTEFGKLCFDTTYNWDLANWLYDRSNPRYSRYSQDTEKYRPQIDKIIRRLTFDDDPL